MSMYLFYFNDGRYLINIFQTQEYILNRPKFLVFYGGIFECYMATMSSIGPFLVAVICLYLSCYFYKWVQYTWYSYRNNKYISKYIIFNFIQVGNVKLTDKISQMKPSGVHLKFIKSVN